MLVTWSTLLPCPYMAKPLKIFFSRTSWPMTLKLVNVIGYISTTKNVPIMTLGWPWSILPHGQILSLRLLYGKKWKLFGNYCRLRSQSWLMHSTNWVNEAKWTSKVKVILCPWLKVAQISELNLVFLRNCWIIKFWNQISFESLWECRN